MYFTFTARSITHFHSVSLYFNLFPVKSSINKGCSNWPDTTSTLMAPTYMTAITYRGITQGRAGKHSAKSLLAITTPVSLKSILKVGEEIVEVLGTGRPGRCLWLIAGCQVPISPMQRWLWEMWSSFLPSSISLSSGRELGDGGWGQEEREERHILLQGRTPAQTGKHLTTLANSARACVWMNVC